MHKLIVSLLVLAAGVSAIPLTADSTQCRLVREIAAADALMTLVIWRGDRYLEVRGPLRHTWQSASLETYDWRRPILR